MALREPQLPQSTDQPPLASSQRAHKLEECANPCAAVEADPLTWAYLLRAPHSPLHVPIAKAAGLSVPLKLVWTREDDMHAGYFRPMYVHTLKAGLDKDNRIVAWRHSIVGQSVVKGTSLEPMMLRNGIDPSSTEGASNLPYDIPNLGVELHNVESKVPVCFWRSVGSSHTAFATECFLDDVARAIKADPVTLRRSLLAKHPQPVDPQGDASGIAVQDQRDALGTIVRHIPGMQPHLGFDVQPDVLERQPVGARRGRHLASELGKIQQARLEEVKQREQDGIDDREQECDVGQCAQQTVCVHDAEPRSGFNRASTVARPWPQAAP